MLKWPVSLLIVHGIHVFIPFTVNTFISSNRTYLLLWLLQKELCQISAFWLHCSISLLIQLDLYLPFVFCFLCVLCCFCFLFPLNCFLLQLVNIFQCKEILISLIIFSLYVLKCFLNGYLRENNTHLNLPGPTSDVYYLISGKYKNISPYMLHFLFFCIIFIIPILL